MYNINNDYQQIININAQTNSGSWNKPITMAFKEGSFYILCGDVKTKIKIWDQNGNYKSELEMSIMSETYFCDTVYIDKNIFIIISGKPGIIVCDFDTKKTVKKFSTGNQNENYICARVLKKKEKLLLLGADKNNGILRIWDFNNINLLKEIHNNGSNNLEMFCPWNERYTLAGCSSNRIVLFDIENGSFVKYFGRSGTIYGVTKINSVKYGECLISWSDNSSEGIVIWCSNN